MNVIAILEGSFRPEVLAEAHATLVSAVRETVAFPGCLGVEIIVDRDDPTRWIAYQRWESVEADAAYRAWRAGDGERADLAAFFAEPPILKTYDPVVF